MWHAIAIPKLVSVLLKTIEIIMKTYGIPKELPEIFLLAFLCDILELFFHRELDSLVPGCADGGAALPSRHPG